jgi:hypothetical protein
MSRNLRPLSSSIYNPRFTSIINLWKVQGKFSRKVQAENRKFRTKVQRKFRTPTNNRTESSAGKFRTPTNCGKVQRGKFRTPTEKVQDTH